MFRKELPRIYELRDQIKDPESPHSCFRDFGNTLHDPHALAAWQVLEAELQQLDYAAWEFLRKEASVYLTKWDEKRGRGREQVLNIINEARAYSFLRKNGCTDIHFIPRSNVRTPDLEAASGTGKVICEVKTINPSEDEIRRRRSGNYLHRESLGQRFFDKLMSCLADAKAQIEAFDTRKEARDIAYIVLNFDSFWGDIKKKIFNESTSIFPSMQTQFLGLK